MEFAIAFFVVVAWYVISTSLAGHAYNKMTKQNRSLFWKVFECVGNLLSIGRPIVWVVGIIASGIGLGKYDSAIPMFAFLGCLVIINIFDDMWHRHM